VINSSKHDSTLKKKHNAIAYHKAWESIAQKTIQIAKEVSKTNLAKVLTKPLPGIRLKQLIQHILYWVHFSWLSKFYLFHDYLFAGTDWVLAWHIPTYTWLHLP
jgi:Fe2+ transport system protein B